MRSGITILLALAVMLAPLRSLTVVPCAETGLGGFASVAGQADEHDCCCEHAEPQRGPQEDNRGGDREPSRDQPCNGCDCPLRCCGAAPKLPLGEPGERPQLTLWTAAIPTQRDGRCAPARAHLNGLKRPPKMTADA